MRQKFLALKRLSVARVLTVFSLALAGCAQPGSAEYTTVLSQLPAASAGAPLSPQQRLFYDAVGAQMLVENNWAAAFEQTAGMYYYPRPTYNIYSWPAGYWSYNFYNYNYWRGHYSRYGW
ncbi:Uncharacterized protein MCB1EB_1205 [Mycoavidus cysteinexigens]|uniref:Uncharacterized protein n=1 Tax=Mycoavidus cysteinexigens TaxID=1553431 RepID=A0A2Z6EVE8_9BURK|nr:hypothetical protein [Mycoavidus cysteinexigens]BBE09366.1 Uncharacterized protein MCB1EB_1205 [Mycoavidus cysteinexigens]GAM51875.1 hypothetical protein EBME_0338 [bacterium endosymbiont of Mortierella elongata FMR23-6]GLR01952.1 hypothetical protein GCM10007934_17650 [Mycoavidus cysteinexigens]